MGIRKSTGAATIPNRAGVGSVPAMRETASSNVFTVLVIKAETVTDAVGPFWNEGAAKDWAERNITPTGYGYLILRMVERGIWAASQQVTD